MSKATERREVLVRISEYDVLDLFNAATANHACIRLPVMAALPEGYTIRAVFQDFHRQCFCFAVAHPSFAVVPAGARLPEWGDGLANVETRRVATVPPCDEPVVVFHPSPGDAETVKAMLKEERSHGSVVMCQSRHADALRKLLKDTAVHTAHTIQAVPRSTTYRDVTITNSPDGVHIGRESMPTDVVQKGETANGIQWDTPYVPPTPEQEAKIKAVLTRAAQAIQAMTEPAADTPHVVPAQE